jgi:hypothetical protein
MQNAGQAAKSTEIDFTPFRLAAQKTSERLSLAGHWDQGNSN